MENVNTAPRLGPLDVPDTFVSGFLLTAALNGLHYGIFLLSDVVIGHVMGMFAPLVGFTQFLYAGPLVAEFILAGKKKAAMGVAAAALITLLLTIVRLVVLPWNENAYFGYEE